MRLDNSLLVQFLLDRFLNFADGNARLVGACFQVVKFGFDFFDVA